MYDKIVKRYQQQINVFNYIEFIPDGHIYKIDGMAAQSVTNILKNYVKPFARDYWADIKAKQENITVDEILLRWQNSNKLSQVKGSVIHSFIESKLAKFDFVYPEELILQMFGYDPIQDLLHLMMPQIERFVADIQDKMYHVASEFIIGDKDSLVCGTIDQLFYNQKSGQLEIWDWKTNKEIKMISKYFHLAPLEHIPDTEFDRYSLQLSLYKLILMKNTGVAIGNCYLTWFNENITNYQIFRAKDYMCEAETILLNLVR